MDNLLREYEGSLEIEPETIQEEGDTQAKIQNFCNRHKYHNIKIQTIEMYILQTLIKSKTHFFITKGSLMQKLHLNEFLKLI